MSQYWSICSNYPGIQCGTQHAVSSFLLCLESFLLIILHIHLFCCFFFFFWRHLPHSCSVFHLTSPVYFSLLCIFTNFLPSTLVFIKAFSMVLSSCYFSSSFVFIFEIFSVISNSCLLSFSISFKCPFYFIILISEFP